MLAGLGDSMLDAGILDGNIHRSPTRRNNAKHRRIVVAGIR